MGSQLFRHATAPTPSLPPRGKVSGPSLRLLRLVDGEVVEHGRGSSGSGIVCGNRIEAHMSTTDHIAVRDRERLPVDNRRNGRALDDQAHLVRTLLNRNPRVEYIHVRASVTAPDSPVLSGLMATAPEPVERRSGKVSTPHSKTRTRPPRGWVDGGVDLNIGPASVDNGAVHLTWCARLHDRPTVGNAEAVSFPGKTTRGLTEITLSGVGATKPVRVQRDSGRWRNDPQGGSCGRGNQWNRKTTICHQYPLTESAKRR